MKKYIEIVADRIATYEQLKEVRNQIDAAAGKFADLSLKEIVAKRKNNDSELAAHDKYLCDLGRKQKNLELTLLFQKNNAKITAFVEFLPVVLEVWNKYANKPYGEKTKQKIYTEIKERCNCSFYVHNGFNITPLAEQNRNTDYGFTCGTKYENGSNKPLLIDNKIQALDFEDFELYYINDNYIADIPAIIEQMQKLETKAIEKQEELKEICTQFNFLAVDGIEKIYCDKRIHSRL